MYLEQRSNVRRDVTGVMHTVHAVWIVILHCVHNVKIITMCTNQMDIVENVTWKDALHVVPMDHVLNVKITSLEQGMVKRVNRLCNVLLSTVKGVMTRIKVFAKHAKLVTFLMAITSVWPCVQHLMYTVLGVWTVTRHFVQNVLKVITSFEIPPGFVSREILKDALAINPMVHAMNVTKVWN